MFFSLSLKNFSHMKLFFLVSNCWETMTKKKGFFFFCCSILSILKMFSCVKQWKNIFLLSLKLNFLMKNLFLLLSRLKMFFTSFLFVLTIFFFFLVKFLLIFSQHEKNLGIFFLNFSKGAPEKKLSFPLRVSQCETEWKHCFFKQIKKKKKKKYRSQNVLKMTLQEEIWHIFSLSS